jgi:hypothetical protein
MSTGTGTRIALTAWRSDSPDGYVGSNQSFVISLEHNITEVAMWSNQSLVSFRSDPTGLAQDVWYNNGPENITLPAVWGNDSYSRMSLTGFTVNGVFTTTGREGWALSTDLEGPMTLTLSGVKQYSVILEGYNGPYNSTSQTRDLWFDSGTDAVVSIPLNFTQNLTRSVFTGWEGGSYGTTVTFPDIVGSHTLTPLFRLQYFVYIGGGYSFSPIPVELISAPSPNRFFSTTPGGSMGAWFDSGSRIPAAVETWNEAGTNDSRSRLTSVVVSFGTNITGPGILYLGSYGLRYGVIGGSINASSGSPYFVPAVQVNGTIVPFQLPSDEMPEIEGGQLVVDRPMSVMYAYSPEFYFSLRTPFGGFEGWVTQGQGPSGIGHFGDFVYSAPELAGFLWTQRFVGWVGTVNSTSPTLSLSVLKPYVETAYYSTDIGAVASVLMAAAALVIGGYFMLRQRQRMSAAGPPMHKQSASDG